MVSSMLHEWEPLLAPGAEEESLLSEGGQTTLNAQNQSPDPFPLVLGAGIAFGTVSFLALMIFLIRVSSLYRTTQNQAALLPEQHQGTFTHDNGRRGAGGRVAIPSLPSRPSSVKKNEAPPRVPVVIVEPDATVEVAYSEEREPENFAIPEGSTSADSSRRVPLWRAPTI